MVVWLAIQVFQVLYGVKLEGDARIFVNLLGFTEVVVEMVMLSFACYIFVTGKYKRY